MATKRNRAGNQQPYVPEGNGDASGEYTNNEGGTISTSKKEKSSNNLSTNNFTKEQQLEQLKQARESVVGHIESLRKQKHQETDDKFLPKYDKLIADYENTLKLADKKINDLIKETGTPAEREKLSNMGIDSFFKTNIEDEVKRRKGQTWNWKETGYILTDGYQLDLSGKRDGAPSGQRSDDHRDIFESEDYMEDENINNTDAMVKFMGRGNIRVSPEYPGINLQIEPTEEQYRKIYDMVARLGRDGFVVDFDNERGDNIGSLNYDDAVSPDRVIADMKHYFKTGEIEDY